jgi:hypothetical protein
MAVVKIKSTTGASQHFSRGNSQRVWVVWTRSACPGKKSGQIWPSSLLGPGKPLIAARAVRERECAYTMCRAPTSSQTDPTWIGTRSGGGRAGDGLGRTVCWAMIDALRCSSSAARAVDAEGEPARSRTERQRTAAVQPRATRAPAELQCQFLRQTR